MIMRRWAGVPRPGREAEYLAFLRDEVIQEMKALPGYEGIRVLRARDGSGGTVIVESYWSDMDAIRGFAGDDPERAVVPSAAQELLESFDTYVGHYEVILEG